MTPTRPRDVASHHIEELGGEQRVARAVVDADGALLAPLDVHEADLSELFDEDTLRQGSGESPGPCGGVGEHLGREIRIHHDVGQHGPPAGSEHAE